MLRPFLFAGALLMAGAHPAWAEPVRYLFDSPFESKTLDVPLGVAGGYRIEGLSGPTPSAVINEFTFNAGSATALSLGATWVVAQPPQRLLGVNIDLRDSSNNVVASDTFSQVANGQAFSSIAFTGLTPNANYTVQLTGTAVGEARYRLDIATPPTAATNTPIPALPAQRPDSVTFDTRVGEKTLVDKLFSGDRLRIETDVRAGAVSGVFLRELVKFTMGETRSFAASVTWLTATGLNVDILDRFGSVVASDAFQGVFGDQAFSLFNTTLGPGTYSLLITATAASGARIRVDLAGGNAPPGFTPIGDPGITPVPEPAAASLFVVALMALALSRSRAPFSLPS